MFTTTKYAIIIFTVICTILLLILIAIITYFVYKYQQKQNAYLKEVEELNIAHENDMLLSKLEIQEQTFQNVSREIHDNIGQKLTLAKLHLNTIEESQFNNHSTKIKSAVIMIGEAISDLSDISRSMSSELILHNGLIKALEFEISQLSKLGLYKLNLAISDKTFFLNAHTELVLFRIVQEALNNIIKHASATSIDIDLHFKNDVLNLQVKDNGKGYSRNENAACGIGLKNMDKRAKMLGGECTVSTVLGKGTIIIIKIPINEPKEAV